MHHYVTFAMYFHPTNFVTPRPNHTVETQMNSDKINNVLRKKKIMSFCRVSDSCTVILLSELYNELLYCRSPVFHTLNYSIMRF